MSCFFRIEVIKITMVPPRKYWRMQLLPIGENTQLKYGMEISRAKEFFEIQFPHLGNKPMLSKEENKQVQTVLWEIFRCDDDIYQQALAGLCLRSYVSHRILITCKTIPHIYNVSAENLFRYTDLLRFVLNDDGRALVILGSEGTTQYILNNGDGTTGTITFDAAKPIAKGELFSVEILRKFNPNLDNNQSLDNWTTRLTRQNQEIRSFLWEFGLATPTDWSLLSKSIPRSMSNIFSEQQHEIIEAFKTVYQRDRLEQQQRGRYLQPTSTQLEEILNLLNQTNITLSPETLISQLRDIAETLRQDWLFRKIRSPKTIPTEIYHNSTNDYFDNPELPLYTDRDLEDLQLEQLQQMCENLFEQALDRTIAEVIEQRIQKLQKSRAYNNFAQRFQEGLRLYYQENMSLNEVAQLWGIKYHTAKRIFDLEDFLDKVQYRTKEIFLEKFLQSIDRYQSTEISDQPDYLQNIANAIKEFAWDKTFREAKAELKASRSQMKNSLFAQRICKIISN